jgi:hypothetical protein
MSEKRFNVWQWWELYLGTLATLAIFGFLPKPLDEPALAMAAATALVRGGISLRGHIRDERSEPDEAI